jgi:amidohydrolase
MMMRDTILQLAKKYLPDTIALRRHLHQYPELSFQETQTHDFVAAELTRLGVQFLPHVAGTGLVALLEGQQPGVAVFALRADLDALPITEANDVPYKSRNEGIMHACGHDVHTAALLGAVRILQETRHLWTGTVKCVFQPGEEKVPGGASLMLKADALENPRPAGIVGQHVYPPLEAGKVGFRSGIYMASSDELYLTVRGKGGHGAMPHTCVDTILIAAHITTALQQVVSRNANPFLPSVLTLGKINSVGGATNVIPDEVKIEGTFRTMDEQWRKEAHQKIIQIASQTAAAMGGTCEVHIAHGYPVLHNNEHLTARARALAEDLLGKERVVELPMRMTSEDFAFYTHEIPGCFYRLGTRNEARGITSPVHTPTFDIDEAALETGMALMAWLAIGLNQ